jgi:hypothetical protein
MKEHLPAAVRRGDGREGGTVFVKGDASGDRKYGKAGSRVNYTAPASIELFRGPKGSINFVLISLRKTLFKSIKSHSVGCDSKE